MGYPANASLDENLAYDVFSSNAYGQNVSYQQPKILGYDGIPRRSNVEPLAFDYHEIGGAFFGEILNGHGSDRTILFASDATTTIARNHGSPSFTDVAPSLPPPDFSERGIAHGYPYLGCHSRFNTFARLNDHYHHCALLFIYLKNLPVNQLEIQEGVAEEPSVTPDASNGSQTSGSQKVRKSRKGASGQPKPMFCLHLNCPKGRDKKAFDRSDNLLTHRRNVHNERI
ncbi:hypothetical protein RUND412_002298 [Rhizina undulata]